MEMCFHGNQHPSSTKHPFISLYSKYHPFIFICPLNMNSPVFPSLDDIYCMSIAIDDDTMTGLSSFALKRINLNGNETIQRYTTSNDKWQLVTIFARKKESNVPKLSWYSSNFWYQIYRIDIIDCDNQELEGRWKSQRLCTSAFLSWFPFLQKLTIKHRKSLAAKFCR